MDDVVGRCSCGASAFKGIFSSLLGSWVGLLPTGCMLSIRRRLCIRRFQCWKLPSPWTESQSMLPREPLAKFPYQVPCPYASRDVLLTIQAHDDDLINAHSGRLVRSDSRAAWMMHCLSWLRWVQRAALSQLGCLWFLASLQIWAHSAALVFVKIIKWLLSRLLGCFYCSTLL